MFIDWTTVLHYGSLIGAYSLLTLLPELNLGIFTSLNGAVQSDPYTINSLLHVHLIDLFLGVHPSVDVDNVSSQWCSPSPYEMFTLRRQNANETSGWTPRNATASAYVGVYSHRVLGQFEVRDDGSGMLTATYGTLETRLRPEQSSAAEFIGVPTDPAWSMLFEVTVQFAAMNGDDGRYRRVNVHLIWQTTFERQDEHSSAAVDTTSLCATASIAITVLASVVVTLLLQHYDK